MKRIFSNSIIIFFTTLFCMIAKPSFGQPVVLDEVIAIANDGIIMRSQLKERMQMIANESDINPVELKKIALEQLIIETIQLQIGKRFDIVISDDELEQTISNIAKQSNSSIEALKNKLTANGISYHEFREKTRKDLIISRVQHGSLRDKLKISEQEIDNFLQSTHGKNINATQYRLLNILLPGATSAANKNFISNLRSSLMKGEVSLKAVLEKQRFDDRALKVNDMGWTSSQEISDTYRASVENMKPRDISEPISSDKGYHILLLIDKQGHKAIMVKQYNARHILISETEIRNSIAAQKLAETIRQRLVSQESFDSLAKLYSDDEGSAVNGGDLGWSQADKYVPEFADTLQALKPDEISPVIKTQFGWHIIQLLGVRDYDISADMLRGKARQLIYQRKFDEALKNWLSETRSNAFVEYK